MSNFLKAQDLLKTEGYKIVSGKDEVILRGINIGGWLLQEGYILKTFEYPSQWKLKNFMYHSGMNEDEIELFYKDYRNNFITQKDINFIASLGFNCIRIPLHYELFLTSRQREVRNKVIFNLDPHFNPADSIELKNAKEIVSPYVDSLSDWYDRNELFVRKDLDAFNFIDKVMEWSKPYNMRVVLDLHAAPGGQGSDVPINDALIPLDFWYRKDKNGRLIYQDITNKLWENISGRYKENEQVAMYNLINEPNNIPKDNLMLKAFYERIINVIRGRGDKHLILLEGNIWGNEYTNLTPDLLDISDKTNLVYSTHRYRLPNSPDLTEGPTQLGGIKGLIDFREKNNVPVWVGETGENSNEWVSAACAILDSVKIGWCLWTLKRMDSSSTASPLRIKYSNMCTPDGREFLLKNCIFDNCIRNRDFIFAINDSLLKDPYLTKPYKNHFIPGIIYATDYDMGRVKVAYKDHYFEKNSWADDRKINEGTMYRNDGVDIFNSKDNDQSNGFLVGEIENGEFLNYTVDAGRKGKYLVELRVKKDSSDQSTVLIKIDDNVFAEVKLLKPSQWHTILLNKKSSLKITRGKHKVEVFVSGGKISLSYLRFKLKSRPSQGRPV